MRTFIHALAFGCQAVVSSFAGKRYLNCLWELTYRCEARCGHCSCWRRPATVGDELQLPEIREGIQRIRKYGCRMINFTGGEPTCRPDLEEIVAHASAKGIWTSMVTSAATLTRERIVGLKQAGLDNLLISLDSVDSSIHDRGRGITGLHERAVTCLGWVRDCFLQGHRMGGIMCALSRSNCAELEDMVRFANRLGGVRPPAALSQQQNQ